jgi:hypothetical protein
MTGWGQEGPLAQTAGHDINYIAVTGALHAIGSAGGPPQIPVNFLGDFGGGGTYLVIGVLAALQEAARSGCGQVVDAAITDGAAHLLAAIHGVRATGTWEDERGVNILDGGAPFYGVYGTADDRYVAVGALENRFPGSGGGSRRRLRPSSTERPLDMATNACALHGRVRATFCVSLGGSVRGHRRLRHSSGELDVCGRESARRCARQRDRAGRTHPAGGSTTVLSNPHQPGRATTTAG